MADTRIGIVTVTYFSADIILDLLNSITTAFSGEAQIVVVDNSTGDDGTAAMVAGRPNLTYLRPDHNLGYGGGMNFGVASLDPEIEWVVFVNPDVILNSGSLDALLAARTRHDDAASFGPLIRSDDGMPYPSARNLPSLRTGIGHATFIRIWPQNPWTTRYRNDLAVIEERAVGWLSGAFLLVKRSRFSAIGGFDDRYFMYFEDVDLGRSFGLAGWKNVFVPTAEVLHHGGLSTSRAAGAMLRVHHVSAYRYLAKQYSAWYLWPLRVGLRVALWARSNAAKA